MSDQIPAWDLRCHHKALSDEGYKKSLYWGQPYAI